jgi:hypothetical protein
LHCRLEARAGNDFDDAAGDAESTVAVAPEFAGRRLLRPVGGPGDVAGQRVVALSGALEPVSFQPAGVREELAQGDRSRGPGIGQGQVRQPGSDRRIEIEQSVLDQPHDQGRGENLAVGADLEQGVGASRIVGFQTDHAVAVDLALPIVEDGHGHARDLPFRHSVADDLIQCLIFHRVASARVLRHLPMLRSVPLA